MHDPLPAQPPTLPCSVKEASARLGITERGVRKRLEAGTLRGTMIDRVWTVYLPVPEAVPFTATATGAVPGTEVAQIPSLYLTLVAQQAAIAAQQDAVAVLKRDAERERNRAEKAEERIALLIAELAELRRPWWRFW